MLQFLGGWVALFNLRKSFRRFGTSCKPCAELQPEFKKAQWGCSTALAQQLTLCSWKAAKTLRKKGILCGAVDVDLAVNAHLKGSQNVTSTPKAHGVAAGCPHSLAQMFLVVGSEAFRAYTSTEKGQRCPSSRASSLPPALSSGRPESNMFRLQGLPGQHRERRSLR